MIALWVFCNFYVDNLEICVAILFYVIKLYFGNLLCNFLWVILSSTFGILSFMNVCLVCNDDDGKMLATMGNNCGLIVIPLVLIALSFNLYGYILGTERNWFHQEKICWVFNKFLSLLLVFFIVYNRVYMLAQVPISSSISLLLDSFLYFGGVFYILNLRVGLDFGTDSLTSR